MAVGTNDDLTDRDLDGFRDAVGSAAQPTGAVRWNAQPDDVQRSVVKLLLSLAEFLRELMERQAVRRMDEGTLAPDEIEALGLALMRLEATLNDLAGQFGLTPEDLNLDLGPIGRLR